MRVIHSECVANKLSWVFKSLQWVWFTWMMSKSDTTIVIANMHIYLKMQNIHKIFHFWNYFFFPNTHICCQIILSHFTLKIIQNLTISTNLSLLPNQTSIISCLSYFHGVHQASLLSLLSLIVSNQELKCKAGQPVFCSQLSRRVLLHLK